MRNIIYMIATVSILMASCGKTVDKVNHDELAGRAAKAYYDYLVEGKYDAYVDGFYRPDSIPASYREQLLVTAKMYVAQMKADHQGLKSVGLARAKADTTRRVGEAFLVLTFGDKTHEEIVVPMAWHDGNWMLR